MRRRKIETALDHIPAILAISLAIWCIFFIIWANCTNWHWNCQLFCHKKNKFAQNGTLSQEDFQYFKRHGVILSVDAMESK